MQYQMSREARTGMILYINQLREIGIMILCQSAWNTPPQPPLPIKKPHSDDYPPVQDLREINKWANDIYPTVSNLYTLPSNSLPSKQCILFLT